MVQPGRGARFAQCPRDQVIAFRLRQPGRQQDLLDRHRALEDFVVATPDLAHGPFPDGSTSRYRSQRSCPACPAMAVMLMACVGPANEKIELSPSRRYRRLCSRRGWVSVGLGRPDEPYLIAVSEEIRRFRDAVRVGSSTPPDAGRDLREIPPAVLLSLLSASGVVLGDLISAAIDGVRADSQGRPPPPQDLEREIYWRIERVLAAQDQRAAVLRAEIAAVLARNDVSSAIDTLSSGYPEMTFLSRADHGLNGTIGQSAD